jgi:hypothetical protein
MIQKKLLGETHINMILGMDEKDAIDHLKLVNKTMRVTNRDNRGLMVTMDNDMNRVNVFVNNGIVTYLDNIG